MKLLDLRFGFRRKILCLLGALLAGCGAPRIDVPPVVPKTPQITWVAPAPISYGTALSATQLNATANVPGSFAYSPSLGSMLSAGSSTLSVTFTPTNSTDYSTATASVTLTVNQVVPVLSWAAPAPITYGVALSATQLNATANVPGAFAYSPSLGSMLSAGSHALSVTFTPTDTTDYSTATASVTLTVNQVVPVLSWAAPAPITYGVALSATQLNATANVPGAFAYSPSLGSMLSAGSHALSVTFTPTDTTDYSTATASVTLTVNQVVPVLSWAAPAPITYGTALSATQLNATANVPGAFAYSPSLGSVLSAGSSTLSVTFTPTDSTDYSTAIASVTLTLNRAVPVLGWAAPAPITYGVALSATQLNATANVPGSFAYSPSLGSMLSAGSHALSVTFTPTDSTDYSTAIASVTLTVNRAVPVLSWAAPASISYGTALSATQLNATANAPGSFAYNPSPGTILSAGSRALSVTFTPTDATDYSTATAGVTLAVNQAVPVLGWAAPAPISYGTALSATQLNATANVPGSFAYNLSPGTILSAGSHALSVTFTPTDATDYSTATASVTLTVNQAVPVLSWVAPAPITYGTALSATQLNATANVPGSFAYNLSPGTILSAGPHALSVTFTPTDSTDYSTTTASVTLTVNRAVPVLSWAAPAPITYGAALSATQLNATANVPGSFAYNLSPGTILSAGSHALSVTFTPTDATDYSTATAGVTLTVNQAVPVLSWVAPAPITYGTALSATQLNATANVPGGFVYSPSVGSVLSAGSSTLSVTFTPTDSTDYSTATALLTLTVTQATPQITWVPAYATAVGVALGPGQLDATATAPNGTAAVLGSFVYSPGDGTVFNSPGPQNLSVTFTPKDTADYTTAETSLTLKVFSFGVAAWGDSLTQGNQGLIDQGIYTNDLQKLIVLPVVNLGLSSETSTQIGVREGGIPVDVTVAGGTIPASGGVNITFPNGYCPGTQNGRGLKLSGTILGVHGTISFASMALLATGTVTFTRTTAGSAVSAPGTPPFVVDTPYASYIPLFWEGNLSTHEAQVLSDMAAQVATVPSDQTYLVLSTLNGNDSVYDWLGGPSYNEMIARNDQLANIYGSHYLDVRKVLVDSYDSTQATDVSDYNHDVPPTSLHAINGVGTLDASIGPADVTFTVNLTTGSLTSVDVLTIDTGEIAENVKILSVSGSTVTVKRNFGGLNSAHAAGAPVTETDTLHLNEKGYQIVANTVASYLFPYENP